MGTEEWEIDTLHSGIYFSVKHMVVGKVRGRFERWSATFVADAADLSKSTVEVVVDAASVRTGVGGRDAHLRSADFLDARNHPAIRFKSSRVQRIDGEHLELTGDLTIRDVTKEIVIEVEETGRRDERDGNERAGFTARTSFDRNDFGLTRDDSLARGMLIGARVDIEIEVEATRRVRHATTNQPSLAAVRSADR